MSSPFVVVLILNNNRHQDTLDCLTSLAQSTYRHFSTIVLNIPPANGNTQFAEAGLRDLSVVTLAENRGYAGNNNIGLHLALDQGADWVWVLNDDTILSPDCLERLVTSVQNDSSAGMAGPMVYHYNEETVIQSAGGVLNPNWSSYHLGRNQADTGQFPEVHHVDWLSGCALLIKRDVIAKLNGFDERLFLYWEEVDLALRVRSQNMTLLQVPGAKLWHKGSLRHHQPAPYVTYYSIRNLFLLLHKHHAPLSVKLYQWGQTIRTLVSWTVKPKWRGMRLHRDAMWQALRDVMARRWGMKPQ